MPSILNSFQRWAMAHAEPHGFTVTAHGNWVDLSLEGHVVECMSEEAVRDACRPRETCDTCAGNGEVVTDWERYMHGPLDANGNDAVKDCPDCDGVGYILKEVAK